MGQLKLDHDALVLSESLAPASLHAFLESEVKHVFDAHACLGGALYILCTNLLRYTCTLFWRDGRQALRAEHSARLVVGPEVGLGRDENEGCALAKVGDLWIPLSSRSASSIDQGARRTLSCTFARLVGKSTENTIRMTSDSG